MFINCVLYTGKVLIIGGGIANFTNVAATFKVGDTSTVSERTGSI